MSSLDRVLPMFRFLVPFNAQPRTICERYMANLRQTGSVAAGPFAGMRYISSSFCSANSPKWLGTYEMELRGIIERWKELPFTTIVDVGAAEGYYAVGCALAWPEAAVIAFEMDANARKLVAELGRLNHLGQRLQIEGTCEPDDLARILPADGNTLVIMDVEGAEDVLLDPERAPALKRCHILVEMHDFMDRKMAGRLTHRFADSHQIEEIWSEQRSVGDFSWPKGRLFQLYLLRCLRAFTDEGRVERMRWFAMTPKPSSNAH